MTTSNEVLLSCLLQMFSHRQNSPQWIFPPRLRLKREFGIVDVVENVYVHGGTLWSTSSQTTAKEQVFVPLKHLLQHLLSQLRGINWDFSLQATDHNKLNLSVEAHEGD